MQDCVHTVVRSSFNGNEIAGSLIKDFLKGMNTFVRECENKRRSKEEQ